jgi:hypothetical protein
MSRRTTRKSSKTVDSDLKVVTEDGDELMESGKSEIHSSSHSGKKSFQTAEWGTVYEHFILNKSKEELVLLLVDILMYFGEGTVEEATVRRVVEYIKDGYYDNSYHAIDHATHVVLNVSHFLLNVQPQFAHHFSRLEKFSTVYAALIHDVGHFGVTNHELIMKKHPFAILYNDQSVAEMNSIKVGLDLLTKPGMDLLENWNEEEKLKFRHNIIELVLATDIADPYKKRIAFLRFQESFINRDNGPSKNAFADTSESNVFPIPVSALRDGHGHHHSEKIYDIMSANCRLAFLLVTLRTADISAAMQSSRTWRIWAKKYFDENMYAHLTNTGPELEIEGYYRSQVGYMEGHVKVLIEKVKSAHILNDSFSDALLFNIIMNINDWKDNGRRYFTEWSSSEECKSYTKKVKDQQQQEMNQKSKKKNSKKRGKADIDEEVRNVEHTADSTSILEKSSSAKQISKKKKGST